jgi:FkbM family methyltransferase
MNDDPGNDPIPRLSYAQNFEDLRLARVFSDQPTGFYVDVGAGDPTYNSVTRLFYDRQWRGVNVEPHAGRFRRLERARPRDVNLCVAIGSASPAATFYESQVNPDLSSLDQKYAGSFETAELPVVKRDVVVRTLGDVLAEHAAGTIDFLKIDVEGGEGEVLASVDLRKFRPRVLIVEATVPSTRIPSWDAWEALLLKSGYVFAIFDALNRFYVRSEEPALAEIIQRPISIFDGIEPYELFKAHGVLKHLGESIGQHASDLLSMGSGMLRAATAATHRLEADIDYLNTVLSRLQAKEEVLAAKEEVLAAKEEVLAAKMREIEGLERSIKERAARRRMPIGFARRWFAGE